VNFFGYELQQSDIWLLGIAGSLFTILLGSLIYRTNVSRINRQSDFKKAATDFRKAFTDILLYLQDDPSIEGVDEYEIKFVGQILNENYNSTLSHARIAFQDYLRCINRLRFNRAWDEFMYIERSNKDRYTGFEFDPYSHMRKNEAKKVATKRVQKLLSFAKI